MLITIEKKNQLKFHIYFKFKHKRKLSKSPLIHFWTKIIHISSENRFKMLVVLLFLSRIWKSYCLTESFSLFLKGFTSFGYIDLVIKKIVIKKFDFVVNLHILCKNILTSHLNNLPLTFISWLLLDLLPLISLFYRPSNYDPKNSSCNKGLSSSGTTTIVSRKSI